MPTFVALLRAVNVGGRAVPMAALRDLCGSLGFKDVRTYIQSGNVVLSAPGTAEKVAGAMEAGIRKEFGIEVPVVVRTAAQWRGYLDPPFPDAAPNRVLLGLSRRPPAAGCVDALRARAAHGEEVVLAGDALWVRYPAGIAGSKLTPAAIDKAVGSPLTARNLNTVRKLAEMAG